MLKKIDINSDEWCDIVFEGKNKEYGAYVLRKLSDRRHLRSLIIVTVLFVFAMLTPSLLKFVLPKKHEANIEVTSLQNIKVEMNKPKELPKFEKTPPPPPLKNSIKFVPPVIKPDEQVKDDEQMKSQDELTQTKTAISTATVTGGSDKGVDVADIEVKKEIVQEEEKPFLAVEQMPEFPGGMEQLVKFLRKNLKYPVIAQEMGIEGTVVLTFVVSKTGNISNIKVIRSIGGGCDEEAQRIVKIMPPWKAGKQNGNAVPVQFTLPVKFVLQKE
ncbi:MAG: TonB family protein [Bacteroidota bacterium]|nr:TonB family protein [Bacteroidota bacterium]MDP4205988.1 TonB family protein [Bacteroidota bacterium]